MVEIVNLQKAGALIPDDTSFVLVKSHPDGNSDIEIWTGEPSKKTTIAHVTNVAPLCFAIQRATEEANRLDLSIVYVQED